MKNASFSHCMHCKTIMHCKKDLTMVKKIAIIFCLSLSIIKKKAPEMSIEILESMVVVLQIICTK